MSFFCKTSSIFRKTHISDYLFYLLLISLILICTFRPKEMADYGSYVTSFSKLKTDRFEIAFNSITIFIHFFSKNPLWLFGVYSFISISLKLYAIKRMSPSFWLSVSIFLSYLFILQDMIQIRVAVASGLLLWAIKFSYERNLKAFILVFILSFTFHTSSLIILPIWFLNPQKISQKFYLFLIPISYIIAIAGYKFGYLAKYIDLNSVQYLWNIYSSRIESNVNIFNILHLARCLICIFILLNIKKISAKYPLAIILIKVYTFAMVSLVLFSDIQVIAFRISQLFMIVEILLIPSIIYVIKDFVLSRILIFIISISLFYISTFYNYYLL